jgi:molybdopterin synthase sulfur carrier subunit
MATVYIPHALRPLVDGAQQVQVAGGSLRQVITAVEQRCPALVGRLREGDNLASGLAVSIDGAFSSRGLLAQVPEASEVHFLPAIGGG